MISIRSILHNVLHRLLFLFLIPLRKLFCCYFSFLSSCSSFEKILLTLKLDFLLLRWILFLKDGKLMKASFVCNEMLWESITLKCRSYGLRFLGFLRNFCRTFQPNLKMRGLDRICVKKSCHRGILI